MLENMKNPETFEQRFWSKIAKKIDREKDTEVCWDWVGARVFAGYGSMTVAFDDGRGRIRLSAHRISYELRYGPFDEKMLVMHMCDNKACVNPHHLFLGTYSDNLQDSIDKGRASQHTPEANRKRREALLGRPHHGNSAHPQTPETRKKIAEAVQRYHDEKRIASGEKSW